ncbi:type VI secretion system baseplate subunit TssG [Burkholderiaceae bacterium UC74_6]
MSTDLARLPTEQLRHFDPLQLARLWLQRSKSATPEKHLRFRGDLDAGFPERPLRRVAVEQPDKAGNARLCMDTPDFCVASTLGPLPDPFTEWVREQDAIGHHATRDFLDLFNQRLNLLRYGMRADFELGLNNDAPAESTLAAATAALMGMCDDGEMAGPPELPTRSWLGIGGLLVGARRSAAGLGQVLSAHLGCPVRVEQLIGAWRSIEPRDRHHLGRGRRLGHDTLLGHRVWDEQSRVRLHIGPLPFAQAQRLLPPLHAAAKATAKAAASASLHDAFAALVRLMLDNRHDAEIDIEVLPPTVPASKVQAKPGDGPGLRLGQTGWVQRDAADGPRQIRFVIPAHAKAAS